MPYVITKVNGKKFSMGHRGSESAVFTKEEVERVATGGDCVTAVNLVTRGTEKFGCKKRKRPVKSWAAMVARERAKGMRGTSCRCKKR